MIFLLKKRVVSSKAVSGVEYNNPWQPLTHK